MGTFFNSEVIFMRLFFIDQEQRLNRPLEEVFEFFSACHNLEQLTPPWLHFQILTPEPVTMAPGTLIDYKLRIHGIPQRWQSEITCWDPPHRFVDEQRKGPYRLWIHEHRFKAEGAHTLVRDQVRYAVPGGWLIQRLFVQRDVRQIFDYRGKRLEQLFGDGSP